MTYYGRLSKSDLNQELQDLLTLKQATATTLGGVKIGKNINIDSNGVISTHDQYTLPIASESSLGGVKKGKNVTITADGTISVADPYVLPVADNSTLGGVKIGNGITCTDGTINVTSIGNKNIDEILSTTILDYNGKKYYLKTDADGLYLQEV